MTSSSAGDLDDLLAPPDEKVDLVDDNSTKAWNEVVDAFRRDDLSRAQEMGEKFLRGGYKTSPYQLLGVQVMMDLANAGNPAVTRDVALTDEMKRLMSERDDLRASYGRLQSAIQAAEARINKLTANRTQAVQAGTAAHRECVRADQEIARANEEMTVLKPLIEANKEKVGKVEMGTSGNLKRDTLKLLDMLVAAEEIEAAFAITNVFTRVVGNDLEVAEKQQAVISLREDQEMAAKLATAIAGEVEPLLVMGKGAEADEKLKGLVAKVEASDQKASVKKMTVAKLKHLDVRITSAIGQEDNIRMTSASEAVEISERVEELEQKLEKAQDYFGTLVRSIDGFSDFDGDFKAESDKDRVAVTLKEKVRSGSVSKEKLDNLIKAKAEHVGILKEVEILQAGGTNLTVVQKGRLANLHATAQTAMDLLKEAAP